MESIRQAAGAALRALPAAGTDPDRVAVVTSGGRRLTYGGLAERADRFAGWLRSQDIGVGGVVAVLLDNDLEFLETAWGGRLAGVYVVALNTRLEPDEIAYIVNDSGAAVLVATDRLPVVARLDPGSMPGVRHRLLSGSARPGWVDLDGALASAPAYVADTDLEGTLMQYTSGTTGRPKGVKFPLRVAPRTAAEDHYTFLTALIGATGDSVYLCPAPLYHSAPFMWTMTMLRQGATVVLMERFEPVRALELIQEHRVTHGQFVPTMFTRMLKLPEEQRLSFDISSLRGVVHAAAPCPVDIKRRMLDWWGPIVAEYWSSSEGAGFAFISATEWLERPGSVGRSLLGPLHIRDEDGRDLPAGQPGVIWAENIDFSYHNDPRKSAASRSSEGWRTVGDVGWLDADGFLYLTDRSSFMIISGGVNIYPQEAENVIIEHPRVMDAAVFGVPDPDLGEVAVALVQPVDTIDTAVDGPDLAAELTDWCESRVARYKSPRRIRFTEHLPRTETGKLMKRKLRDAWVATEPPPAGPTEGHPR